MSPDNRDSECKRSLLGFPGTLALLLCLMVLVSWTSVYVRSSVSSIRYLVQGGTPATIPNFVQPAVGCNWSGIGGQVFDLQGNPLTGVVVKISGKLEGVDVFYLTLTGSSAKFGPGGYEVKLADHPVASQGSIFLQLLDIAVKPISSPFAITTYASCEQNLVIINLVAVTTDNDIYLPLILK